MGKKTVKHQKHVEAGARIVDFGGWDMPLHYGSQKEEHHAVRQRAGMFDVSHMTIVDIEGARAREFLRYLLANDVGKLVERGKAMYSCMLNGEGGIIDDLIVYHFDETSYRLIVNAATRDKDLAWIHTQAEPFGVAVTEQQEMAMIAVQGPAARDLAAPCIEAQWREAALALKPFFALEAGDMLVARTGYTGEDGWEILLPEHQAIDLWERLLSRGVVPCGLAARDTLRLEAGMHLYGVDMDETTSPLESGLGWTVAWVPADRQFIGREALADKRPDQRHKRFVGLLLEDKGVLRNQQRVVVDGAADGVITSGGYSPTIGRSIALARLPAGDYDRARAEVRGKLLNVKIVPIPFVRNGRIQIDV
jgi:aminomethyltransferase